MGYVMARSPSLKVTVPVVTDDPPLVTVAVSVTLRLNCDGLRLDVTLVAVVASAKATIVSDSSPEPCPALITNRRVSVPSALMAKPPMVSGTFAVYRNVPAEFTTIPAGSCPPLDTENRHPDTTVRGPVPPEPKTVTESLH